MPKGLYARSLLIIIAPVVILQSVVAYVFMERHWQTVTRRLSAAVTHDIAALIDLYESYPQDKDDDDARRASPASGSSLDVEFLPRQDLPPPGPKPFFSILDETLSRRDHAAQFGRPFWIDTVGRSNLVEIRIQLDDGVLRVLARRNQAYASNSHIFLVWMVGSSLVLLGVAILFLRNQIRPILRLAEAAESFGKGRDDRDSARAARARCARPAHAFIEMRRRVERAIEQRTAMLNGVSHDLRTILTRFKLSLALIDAGRPRSRRSSSDVDEMSRMLEAYLAFARGDAGEQSAADRHRRAARGIASRCASATGHATEVSHRRRSRSPRVRPDAFKRCLANLVANAARHGDEHRHLRRIARRAGSPFTVDDDGPGMPPRTARGRVQALPAARRGAQPGRGRHRASASPSPATSPARMAATHLGDPLGGLRATVRVPA